MNEATSIKPENLRNVSVPLEISQIKEFFENKELFFLVDYNSSKIKGNMFLTYLSNLDIPCEIVLSNTTKEEKFELLKCYMETRNLNTSKTLKLMATQIILEKKNFNSTDIYDDTDLTKDECLEFIAANIDIIDRWNVFISSMMIYYVTAVTVLEDEFKFKNTFNEIDDPHYIGTNVVQLFSVPGFLETFYSVPADSEIFYFKQQFEEYMFRGKSIFEFFCNPENTLFLLFNEMLSGKVTLQAIDELMTKAE